MRQILVDHARRRNAGKRGSGEAHTDLDGVDPAVERDSAQVLAIEEALGRLTELDPALTAVVECRYLAGLTEPETARNRPSGRRELAAGVLKRGLGPQASRLLPEGGWERGRLACFRDTKAALP